MAKYILELNEEQAEIVSRACEFYARVRIGQFNEIIWHTLGSEMPEDYCGRRELAEQKLLETRRIIYPELHGIGHSYGMGKFRDADLSYDVHQVLRKAFGSGKEPFSYNELPIFDTPTAHAVEFLVQRPQPSP